jgi:hypothetical protein
MSDLRLAISPITDKVYAGKIKKDGTFYQSNKTDVTNDFIGVVIARWNGYREVITDGSKQYEVIVRELD